MGPAVPEFAKLAELLILLDQENAAGRANISSCAVLFDIPDVGVSVQISGCREKDYVVRMIRGLMMHACDVEPLQRQEIAPANNFLN